MVDSFEVRLLLRSEGIVLTNGTKSSMSGILKPIRIKPLLYKSLHDDTDFFFFLLTNNA